MIGVGHLCVVAIVSLRSVPSPCMIRNVTQLYSTILPRQCYTPMSHITYTADQIVYLYPHEKGFMRLANVSISPRAKLPSRPAPSALAPKTLALVTEQRVCGDS